MYLTYIRFSFCTINYCSIFNKETDIYCIHTIQEKPYDLSTCSKFVTSYACLSWGNTWKSYPERSWLDMAAHLSMHWLQSSSFAKLYQGPTNCLKAHMMAQVPSASCNPVIPPLGVQNSSSEKFPPQRAPFPLRISRDEEGQSHNWGHFSLQPTTSQTLLFC